MQYFQLFFCWFVSTKTKKMKKFCILFLFSLGICFQSFCYDWTYITTVTNNSGEKKTFYLWLPENAQGVRGIIMTSAARISQLSGDTTIRKACAQSEIGIMGCQNLDGNFKQADTVSINKALAEFAIQSKFAELNNIPLASYGTSVGGIFAWEVAYAYKGRFFGIIQDNSVYTTPPAWATPGYKLEDVPLILSRGYNEPVNDKPWYSSEKVLAQRALGGSSNMILKAGNGHFSWTIWEAKYLAKWIQKAATARIPGGEYARNIKPILLPVQQENGWLTDTNFTSSPIAVSSYASYTANKSSAFWHFDQEMAEMWISMHQDQFAKPVQLGQLNNSTLGNCQSPWQTCTTYNIGDVPTFNPQAVTSTSFPVRYGVYNGPFKVESNNTISIDPTLIDETSSGWIVAIQEGGTSHQGWEGPVKINVSKKNTGQDQTTSFQAINDLFHTSNPIAISATSSSGLPVVVRIKSGPAELIDNQIHIKPFAGDSGAKAAVVLRYGQGGNGSFKTAALKTDTFFVTKIITGTKKNLTESFGFYPNPSHSKVFWRGQEKPLAIKIFSVQGKEMMMANANEIANGIEISQLAPGYYLAIFRGKQKSGSFSFIKN